MVTLSDPLHAARSLRDVIWNARADTERGRVLAPPVVAGLVESGLGRLNVPASLGGYEADPLTVLQVYEELAGVEASAAWIVWNNQLVGIAGRHLADGPRADIFGDPRALYANSTRPTGTARVVEGGIRLSGRYSLVSGCQLADWILLIGTLIQGSETLMLRPGVPAARMAFVPKGSYEIVDTWHVGGLRGTGSHDVVVEDVFVPDRYTCSFLDPNLIDRPLFRMPFRATMSVNMATIALGIARAALDTFVEIAGSKVPVNALPTLKDRPDVQGTVATFAAQLDAARLLLYDAVRDLWDSCQQGVPLTPEQHGRAQGGAAHAAKTAKAVVTAMYELAGTSSLYEDCLLERAQRDVYAVGQHSLMGNRIFLEDAGRIRLGLPAKVPLF